MFANFSTLWMCKRAIYSIKCWWDERNSLIAVLNYDIDVAAVTETWLNNSVASSDLTITGYNLIRCDRLRRKGGGLCVFVKNCLVDRLTLPLLHTCSNGDEFREVLYLKVTVCRNICSY